MENQKNRSQDNIIKAAGEIMDLSRHMILVSLRFLDSAVHRLPVSVCDEDVPVSFGMNGSMLYYEPEFLARCYKKEPELAARMYLHSLLHGIFQHYYIDSMIDQRRWNLACDISAEAVICELELESVKIRREDMLADIIDDLREKLPNLTAERIFRFLQEEALSEERITELEELFRMDDHALWYVKAETDKDPEVKHEISGKDEKEKAAYKSRKQEKTQEQNQTVESEWEDTTEQGEGGSAPSDQLEEQAAQMFEEEAKKNQEREEKQLKEGVRDGWKKISLQIQMELETFLKERGEKAGTMIQNLRAVNRETYDYRSFLEKFAVLGEAMELNDEEFDYIFYTYGLQVYGNVPLVEPLEYKEVKKVKDFVIVIDTSGSTRGELVQTFVQKTFNILKQQEHFHQKMNLHLIQCDAEIQEDVKITNETELDRYLETMEIKGQGGTDFRPAFAYVDQLIKNGEFENLKGLIYFTDGFGIFPEKQPEYKTAVVYVEEEYENPEVPVWAIKLVLKPEEI